MAHTMLCDHRVYNMPTMTVGPGQSIFDSQGAPYNPVATVPVQQISPPGGLMINPFTTLVGGTGILLFLTFDGGTRSIVAITQTILLIPLRTLVRVETNEQGDFAYWAVEDAQYIANANDRAVCP